MQNIKMYIFMYDYIYNFPEYGASQITTSSTASVEPPHSGNDEFNDSFENAISAAIVAISNHNNIEYKCMTTA
jgi:hypothetical protein